MPTAQRRSVLFLNRVYPPAPGATGELLAELAPELVQRGWKVTVVTTSPATGCPASELAEGVRVERVRCLRFTRANHLLRAASYLSVYPALFYRTWRLPRPDIIVTLTDPPLQLVLGILLKGLRRTRLLHWAQDVYPELAERLGVIPADGTFARFLRRISTLCLRRYDAIIAVGGCMQEVLVRRGLCEDKIVIVQNWADADRIRPVPMRANPFRRDQGLEGRFVVMYSGNFGLAHDFDVILQAAEQLQNQSSDTLFLMVGDGPRLAEVKAGVASRSLQNVRFLPFQSRDSLSDSLSAPDVHLVTIRADLGGMIVPSKAYPVWVAGRPVIFSGPENSEIARFIAEHGCGSVINSASGPELADCLRDWAEHPERVASASNAAVAATEIIGLREAASKFEHCLNTLV